jgi:glycosyltransferase involved in cell wall biosynthesis
MLNAPKIFFGLTLHNGATHLRSAIDSILSQSYRDFRILAIDDASSDATHEIMLRYSSVDDRITYYRRKSRQGLIKTWREVFFRAQEGGMDYFAWATDHDLWHPDWLLEHLTVLTGDPEAVLAYPLTIAINSINDEISRQNSAFDTHGMQKIARIRKTCRKITGAGNMIYGLFRAEALNSAGVFPSVLMPDRLLLTLLSTCGTYRLIPRYLWYRRFIDHAEGERSSYEAMIHRQRSTLFPFGKTPWHAQFPMISQTLALIWYLSVKPPHLKYHNAHLGPYMAYLLFRRKRRIFTKELQNIRPRIFQWNFHSLSK